MNIYFIEYKNTIKFFQDDTTFELIKNEKNYIQFQKVLSAGKYNFINLI